MALIKHLQSETVVREAVVLDLGDLSRQAAAMKASALEEAHAIKQAAGEERERLISGAAEKGYSKGYAEGLDSGRLAGFEAGKTQAFHENDKLIQEIHRGWSTSLDDFDSARNTLMKEARTDIVRLALAIAQRVTRRAVSMDEQAVLGPLEAAISQVMEPTRIVVNIHPDDAEVVAEAFPQLVSHLAKSPHLDIRNADGLERGDCVIETQGGTIDARINTQLDRIVSALLPDRPPLEESIDERKAPAESTESADTVGTVLPEPSTASSEPASATAETDAGDVETTLPTDQDIESEFESDAESESDADPEPGTTL